MGCAFVDVNRDGLLDLYVANYVHYDPALPLCETNGIKHGCTPNQYNTQPNELYINLGGGHFAERSKALGADDPNGAGLGVLVCDFDNDGWPDIFVANDGTPNALLHNEHGHFRNVGQPSSVAYSEDGAMRAGMGTDAADVDGDGLLDLFITNFQHEPNSLYKNDGKMQFHEITYPSGTGTPTLNHLAFGAAFGDFDGDGKMDIYVGNGHVYENVAKFDDTATFEQQDQVFHNIGGGRFEEVPVSPQGVPEMKSVARGVTVGDFKNDGAIGVLINSLGHPVRLLENHSPHNRHWVGLKLKGTHSNRSAIGARIEYRSPTGLQVHEVRSGGSYLSQPDLRQLFYLDPQTDPSSVTFHIRWPNGKTQEFKPPTVNSYNQVVEH